ncbi:MAG: hypothetical protein SFY92_00860 [Verrucomicrobiae bacterium]|nr:hypothetical protein [Verrucomicrobiae bacterium]
MNGILLYESNPALSSYFSRLFNDFAKEDTFILTTESLSETTRILEDIHIQLFVFHEDVPSLGSVELLHLIRNRFPLTRTMVLTESVNPDQKALYLENGAIAVTTFPDSPESASRLRESIRSIINSRRMPALPRYLNRLSESMGLGLEQRSPMDQDMELA